MIVCDNSSRSAALEIHKPVWHHIKVFYLTFFLHSGALVVLTISTCSNNAVAAVILNYIDVLRSSGTVVPNEVPGE